MRSRRLRALALVFVLVSTVSCLTHLSRAKRYYAQGQDQARAFQTGPAIAYWKKALEEASRECRRRPSAQAFTVKGLTEANLWRWREAESSFLTAFALGFGDGEAWAADSALAGLAASFEDRGLEAPALRIYAQIVDRSDFKPALMVAAERRTNLALARTARSRSRREGQGACRPRQDARPPPRPRLRLRPFPLSPRPGRRASRRPATRLRGGGHGPRARLAVR